MILSTATVTGRQHRLMQQNGHDFAIAGRPADGFAFGVVLDGCGSRFRAADSQAQIWQPAQSEVGAKLIGRHIAEWLQAHLATTQDNGLDSALNSLFDSSLMFLASLVDAIPFISETRRQEFVASHLMATVVGFAVTPLEASFFWSGDGFICQDGQVIYLDSHNEPDYLVRHFSRGRPNRFERQQIEQPAETRWLAVATDGWQADLLASVSPEWSGLELQRWLNVKARNRSYFEDDGAIVVWCNTEPDPGTTESGGQR